MYSAPVCVLLYPHRHVLHIRTWHETSLHALVISQQCRLKLQSVCLTQDDREVFDEDWSINALCEQLKFWALMNDQVSVESGLSQVPR